MINESCYFLCRRRQSLFDNPISLMQQIQRCILFSGLLALLRANGDAANPQINRMRSINPTCRMAVV